MEFWQRIMNISTKHRQAILGIAYRLPLLFWTDLRLRVNQVDASRQGYAFCLEMILVCLMLVNKRLLAYIYRIIACAIIIMITWPIVKERKIIELLYVDKTYLLVSSVRDNGLRINWYFNATVCFLSLVLCFAFIGILKDILKKVIKRTLILSLLYGGSHIVCYTGTFKMLVQQCIITLITYDLFQIDFYLFIFLASCATTFSEIDVQFYGYCIAVIWLYLYKDEQGFGSLFLKMKGFFLDFSFENVFLNEAKQVFLFYSLFLWIGIFVEFLIISIFAALYSEIPIVPISNLLLYAVTAYSATIVGIISYIASITYACHGIILFSIWLIEGHKHNIEINVPVSPALLIIFMALQTFKDGHQTHGQVMLFSLLLVVCPLLVEIRKSAEPVLLELGTSGRYYIQNCKAVFLFVILLVIPLISIFYVLNAGILNHFHIFFVLVFTSSWIAVSVESLGSILVYMFLLFDSLRSEPMQRLDDHMYVIRAAVGLIQIIIGLIHVFNVGWSLTSVQWSWVGCLIFGICLFTTYINERDGWKDFQRRRLTAQRLSFLQNATIQQLEQLDDVCSICLRRMSSAKITPCNHYFHETCLKKWSYIRETCPMCNKIISMDWFVQRIFRTLQLQQNRRL